jgi:hypothetical protein
MERERERNWPFRVRIKNNKINKNFLKKKKKRWKDGYFCIKQEKELHFSKYSQESQTKP